MTSQRLSSPGSRGSGRWLVIVGSIVLLLVAIIVRGRDQQRSERPAPSAATTSRDDLARTVATMRARLDEDGSDATAAVALTEALLRQARVDNDPALAIHAERALRRVLASKPREYSVRRALGAALLSQHRFREAIAEATKAKTERPADAWNEGVIGDAHLELGEYDEAFAAFDRMMAIRPSAAAYARASYARELQGERDAAAVLMTMSLEATSANDPESQAWHEVQLGHLAFENGALADARQHFQRAEFLFPRYTLAADGLIRVLAAEGNMSQALTRAREQLTTNKTSTAAIFAGDLALALGEDQEAERHYQTAENLLRYEPAALAVFLADRDRNITRAVELAQNAASNRQDIFTLDALAWSLFKAGRTIDALVAIRRALRTGTADRHILAHAAAIRQAAGDESTARRLAQRALRDHEHFDLVGANEARRVLDGDSVQMRAARADNGR